MSDSASVIASPAPEIKETTPDVEVGPAAEAASIGETTPAPTPVGKTQETKKKRKTTTTKKTTAAKKATTAKRATTTKVAIRKPSTSTRKTTTTRKTTATKAAVPKAKTSAAKVAKASSSLGRPPWKTIIQECIADHKDEARQGVSRSTIKKYAMEKYKVEVGGNNQFQLNRAIATGAEEGTFVLPKGLSGKVKLAPKIKTPGASKENSKPPSKSATSKAPAKKAAVGTKASAPKKTLAGKGKAAVSTKKATTKRGSAKKALTGSAARAAATKKTPAKKAPATRKKAGETTGKKPGVRSGRK